MGINLVVAVTDDDWFEILRRHSNLNEVNFWAPSAVNFHALLPGEMFLFKLHAPRNVIVGGGIFAYANALPCSLAWAAFGDTNGARSAHEMRTRIARYRKTDPDDRSDFAIGCRILTPPLLFRRSRLDSRPAELVAKYRLVQDLQHRRAGRCGTLGSGQRTPQPAARAGNGRGWCAIWRAA